MVVSNTSLGLLETSRTTTSVTRFFRPRTTVSNTIQYDIKIEDCSHFSVDNCVREGSGYCRIQWKQSSITSPDPFQLDTQAAGSATAAGGSAPGGAVTCALAYVQIPDGSDDGLTAIPTFFSTWPFQPQWCGSELGYTGVAAPLNPSTSIVCKSIGEPVVIVREQREG